MTRSHKHNDRDHQPHPDGHHPDTTPTHLPRYFAKRGHSDADPKKTKKNGGGKANWGRPGSELDPSLYNHSPSSSGGGTRRRSNSLVDGAAGIASFKTKFETVEPEPVFEEELHGASALVMFGEGEGDGGMEAEEGGNVLERKSTSGSMDSVEADKM